MKSRNEEIAGTAVVSENSEFHIPLPEVKSIEVGDFWKN